MTNRWMILAVLFLARLSMAYQFQSVASLSVPIAENYQLGLAQIGLLIGLYLSPGVVVAIPGGALAARIGEKRIVTLGLCMMLLGGLIGDFGPGWTSLVAGRVLAGAGGVILNIVMTKMLVDWFAGREISTAMAIFVNSWPVGIALALLTLPGIAARNGVTAAHLVVLGTIALGLALFVLFYRPPPGVAQSATAVKAARLPVLRLSVASLIWALYNTALAMVFSFGLAFLSERGWSPAYAGSATAVFMVVLSVALPIGGVLADKTGRRDTIIAISLLTFAGLLPLVLVAPAWGVATLFVVIGFLFGLGAGPIMTLPSDVLTADNRTFGMGVFFTVYYGVMMVAPPWGGKVAEWWGNTGAAFVLGAGMSFSCLLLLIAFRQLQARTKPTMS